MNTELLLVLMLLGAAIVMFIANRPRMDAVALLMIVLITLTGVITINEALAGFSDPSIILIAGLFVIGEGLVRTGVARRLGDWLNATAGDSETRMLVLLMLSVAGLGAFMSSTAVVAIFIPVVLRICQNTGTAPSQLMMPLSVAALLSGMLTLVATAPNLVVNAELIRQGSAGFSFFSFTPFGLVFVALGVAYMFFARRMLPKGDGDMKAKARQPTLRDWVAEYGLTGRAYRERVLPGSLLAGKRLEEVTARVPGVYLLAIETRSRFATEVISPVPRTVLEVGHVLLLDIVAPGVNIAALRHEYGLEEMPLDDGGYSTDRSQELGMAEVVIPPDSNLIGQSVRQARMRGEIGLTVLGLRRGRKIIGAELLETTLKGGAWPVHLQHGDGRADGAGGARGGEGSRRLALSVCHDHCHRRVGRLHDAGFLTGEHAGGGAGELRLRRFREGRRAVHADRDGGRAGARAIAAAPVTTHQGIRAP